MKDEIKEILDIENYRNKDGYVENINLLPDEMDKLKDYITNLQEELKEKKEIINKFIADENGGVSYKLQNENEKLHNIINELEKYIGQEYYCFDNESVEFEVAKNILDKLKELKEGK